MIELRFTGNTLTDDGAPRQGRRLAGIGKLRHSVGALKTSIKARELGQQLLRHVVAGALLAGIDAFAQLGKRADDPAPVGRMRCALRAGERGFEADWRLADAVLPQQLA